MQHGSGGCGEPGRGTLLDEFLVPPLHRAVPVAEDLCPALAVAEHLHLHVTGSRIKTFEIQGAAAEGRLGFSRCLRGQPGQFPGVFHQPDAAPAAPEDCFDQQRVTDGFAEARCGFDIVDFDGGGNGHSGRHCNFACAALVSDGSQRLRSRTCEGDVLPLEQFGQLGLLA